MNTLRIWAGIFVFIILSPFIFVGGILRKRDRREYALTHDDRDYEIRRKFGESDVTLVHSMLNSVLEPTDQVLGAIIFLANNIEHISDLVVLANSDRERLLNAATVKDERG